MGSFSYENQGTNTFLVYEFKESDEIDSMTLGMLTHNRISGLAATTFTQMDAEKYLKYNISAKVSVKQFFNGPVNRKRLLGVFNGITDAMLSAEEYMIDQNSILLDTEFIFADVSTCETVLVCLPLEKLADNPELGVFFKNVMFGTQFDQTENCDHVAQIINYLNSAPVFSITDFKALLNKLDGVAQRSAAPTAISSQQGARVPRTPQLTASQIPVQRITPSAQPQQRISQPSVAPTQTVSQPTFAVPNAAKPDPVVSSQQAGAASVPSGEEKMSMLYLLRHYSRENAEKYKAQQEADKARKEASKSNHSTKKEKLEKKKKASDQKAVNMGQETYSVPGAPGRDLGFAVPNQGTLDSQVFSQTAASVNIGKGQDEISQPQYMPTPTQGQYTQNVSPLQQTQVYQAPASAASAMNFGNTTVLSTPKTGETTVLSGAMGEQGEIKPKPYLVRQKNNEKIMISKPVFRVGKEKSYVDYFIGDNSAISRSHANIITREGSYFVADTNSTNHTYVNGAMIGSNVEVPIDHGTIIVFANESFEFKLY